MNEVLEQIARLAQHYIPYYAYGDNEAACEMSHRLEKIYKLACENIVQQPLSGSGETPSPKCPSDTSNNGERCVKGEKMNYLDYRNKIRVQEIKRFKESTKSRQLKEWSAVEEEWMWKEIMRLRENEKNRIQSGSEETSVKINDRNITQMTGKEIYKAVDEIINSFKQEDFSNCAINWADIGAKEVKKVEVLYPYPETNIEVLVEEASPDNYEFCKTIQDKFAQKYGFAIQVNTEW